VLFITGSAGYGKTTLISQYLKNLNVPFLFYRIDEEDNAALSFLWNFIRGMEQKFTDFGRWAKELLQQQSDFPNLLQIAKIVTNDFTTIKSTPFVIVFDDYHNIDEKSETNRLVDHMIANSPDKIHFIFLSRYLSPLPSLTRLGLAGNLFELKEPELCFTRRELGELVSTIYQLSMDKAEYEVLLEYTEGWITGIHIILQCCRDKPLIKTVMRDLPGTEIFDYFINEVFLREPPEVRDFLVRTAIFDEINAEICRGVLGVQDPHYFFHYLERHHLFISRIETSGEYYRYHPLFRDFLLKKIPAHESGDLWKKAGRYFVNLGDHTRAFQYFLKGENYKEAEELLTQEARTRVKKVAMGRVRELVSMLPEEKIKDHPFLLLIKAQKLFLNEQNDEAKEVLSTASRLLEGKQTRGRYGRIRAKSLYVWYYTNTKQYGKALSLSMSLLSEVSKDPLMRCDVLNRMAGIYFAKRKYKQAQKCLEDGLQAVRDRGFYEAECSLRDNLAVLKCQQGDYHDAYDDLIVLYEKYRFHYPFKIIVPCVNLILLEIKMHRLADAQVHVEWLIYTAQKYQLSYFHIRAMALMGIIESELGHEKKARNLFGDAVNLAKEHSPNVLIHIHELMLQYYISYRRLDLAEKMYTILSKEKFPPDYLALYGGEFLYQGRKYAQALEYFTQARGKAKEIKDKFYEAKANWSLAKTLLALGKKERASRYADAFLKIAQKKRYQFLLQTKNDDEIKELILSKLRTSKNHGFGLAETEGAGTGLGIETVKQPGRLEQEREVIYDLRLNFFGSFNVSIKNKNLPIKWHSEKVLSLFAYLCARPGYHGIDKLIEEFWPNHEPAKGRNIIYASFSHIRKYFKPYFNKNEEIIKHRLRSYSINPALNCGRDIEEFEESIKRALSFQNDGKIKESIKSYEHARELYKGDFLPGLYETWSNEERDYYRSRHCQVLKNLGLLYESLHEFESAARLFEICIKQNPGESELYVALAEILTKQGNKKRALKLEKDYEKTMAEMSLTPDAAVMRRLKGFFP
jgi:ATP/maltotriose-dependent transcriptional regulator MalT/two-component SAPR family response regulator